MTKGIFITFEGPEGSGKSVHSRRLAQELTDAGYSVVHTAEPGHTALGKLIRGILLEKDTVPMNSMAELFLFEADRAEHVDEVVRPALLEKKIVICDRFNTATFAYQGYGLGTDTSLIKKVDDLATGGLKPDLTILLDVDVETGLKRAKARGAADRMEKRDREFHEKVRRGYLEMAKNDGSIKVINSIGDIDTIYEKVKKEIYGFIEGHTGSGERG